MIPLNSPVQPDLEKLLPLLNEINENNWFTNFGPLHERLTNELENYLGVENLLLVANGTIALQVAGRALNVDSIVTTAYSFAATATAFEFQRDRVGFIDIDQYSLNMDPGELRSYLAKNNPQAIVPCHIYGNPCDIETIEALAREHDCKVIYDAAQCFGVEVSGRSILSYGDASCISFHATKLFHSIEGGAIIFQRREDFLRAKRLINFGFDGQQIESAGINGKMNEYQAAVGLVNLASIDLVMEHRKQLIERYRANLGSKVSFQKWHENSITSGGYMPAVFNTAGIATEVCEQLARSDIQSRKYFSCLHKELKADIQCPIAEEMRDRVVTLPLFATMSFDDVDKVCKEIKKVLM